MRRLLLMLGATGAIVIVFGATALAGGGGCHRPATASDDTNVVLADNCFDADITHIDVGETVTWINKDSWQHNIFSRAFAGTPDMEWGDTFSATFDESGVFPYVCTLHPGMLGAIVVGDIADTVATEPPPVAEAPASGGLTWLASAGLLGGGIALATMTGRLRRRVDLSVTER